MRITENMMTNLYNRNLQRNISNLSSSNLKLASNRKYNHVSEDPANASKAFSIRDQIARNEERIDTVKSATGELETADASIQTLNSILTSIFERGTRAGGTSSQDTLDSIAKELNGLKEEMLQTMNARYGDKYLFSGSANDAPPFSLDAAGRLLFNGKPVDDYDINDPDTYFPENRDVYLDIGFGNFAAGLNTDRAGVKISTAGVDVLGYGKDAGGFPNNLYSLVSKAEGQLLSGDKKGFLETLEMVKKKQSNVSIATSELGTREKLLERTQERLEVGLLNLQKSQKDLEAVEVEKEAIDNKTFETAWMITLQLGSSIIPPSIFDFMR